MRKTRDLFKKKKKMEKPRAHFCKDGHNKWQKWYDLTEAEYIKKRW